MDANKICLQALESVRRRDELEHRRILRELHDGGGRLRIVVDPSTDKKPARVRVRLLRENDRNVWLFAGWMTPRGIDELRDGIGY
jgi:hypothetical protein